MQSNGWQSVLCGRQVHITAAGTGVSVVATIQDSCPGCGKNSLDLTVDLWNQMNAQAGHKFNGLFNIEWYFL
ncbi:hypothetical protein BCR39DRAFT_560507 [Naematelia encephala]|uniref:Barwin domain-containing protein n=1 Tax=Naematelia encephala TaxID=71784 RepID=A0A1Y2AV47_9TREE|nr:hypothetical protein BCR39DRAFT_560507 [Naematelia encephala]